MPLNILLTTPPIERVIEPLYDKPLFLRNSLASIAGYIRTEPEFSIRCIDAKFENRNIKNLLSEIMIFKPDVLGISAFTYEIKEAGLLAKEVKKEIPECIIIIGGSHISALPQETLKEFPDFDVGCIGESERTMMELCKSILNKKGFDQINGIVFRDINAIIHQTLQNEKIHNLVDFPIPAWDILPSAKEYFIQTSRGCPFHCNFCFNPNGNRIRTRKTENIISEINFIIEKFHPERISFGDEAFAANKKFAHELLDSMIYHNIGEKVKWDIQTHVAFIDDELLLKMKKANIQKIELGVESGNDEILVQMGKGINKQMIEKAFGLAKKHKIKTGAFAIFGHPNETKSSIWETIRFISKLNPSDPIFAIMVPFPGTKVAEFANLKINGYKNVSRDWSLYRKQMNDSVEFSNFSIKKLKLYLVLGNLYVFLVNFRLVGLIKFLYQNKLSAWAFIKSLFGNL